MPQRPPRQRLSSNALISTNGVISGWSAIRTLNASFPLLELMNATTIACESTAEIMVQLWSSNSFSAF